MTSNITHSELVEIGRNFLLKNLKYGIVTTELSTAARETPDIFGLRSYYSIVIECKVSRADFLKDKKKPFRQFPEQGMGNFRLFLCPDGLILKEELPQKWGLLYWTGKRIKKIVCPAGNAWDYTGRDLMFIEKNHIAEYQFMVSLLRRIKLNLPYEI